MLRARHFFSLSQFVSLLAVSIADIPFVSFLSVGRIHPTSTRSMRISSRGLVSPTIHPPIVIYFHFAVHSVY
jgi:hypothetical protein